MIGGLEDNTQIADSIKLNETGECFSSYYHVIFCYFVIRKRIPFTLLASAQNDSKCVSLCSTIVSLEDFMTVVFFLILFDFPGLSMISFLSSIPQEKAKTVKIYRIYYYFIDLSIFCILRVTTSRFLYNSTQNSSAM